MVDQAASGEMLTSPRWDLDFPRVQPAMGTAFLRTEPEDFVVEEVLDNDFTGAGEHLYLLLRKRNLNTSWLADRLAELCQVAPLTVGYAGRKDRRAVTSQWFSIATPNDPDLDLLLQQLGSDEQVELLAQARHSRKLRRGQHQANRFIIRLRQLSVAQELLEQRLAAIGAEGVPNYFGEQRFGHGGSNLSTFADRLQNGRLPKHMPRRDLVLSAARSWIFNRVLSIRVQEGSWNQCDNDEPWSHTGPLWGRGRSPLSAAWASKEQQWLASWEPWLYALEHAGLAQERRPLCLKPETFSWHWLPDGDLQVAFTLPPGTYATAVLRELTRYETVHSRQAPGEPESGYKSL